MHITIFYQISKFLCSYFTFLNESIHTKSKPTFMISSSHFHVFQSIITVWSDNWTTCPLHVFRKSTMIFEGLSSGERLEYFALYYRALHFSCPRKLYRCMCDLIGEWDEVIKDVCFCCTFLFFIVFVLNIPKLENGSRAISAIPRSIIIKRNQFKELGNTF